MEAIEKSQSTKLKILTYMDNSTLHGIGKIRKSKNIYARLTWSLMMIFCFFYLVYQVYGLGIKLNKNEYNTIFSTVLQNTGGVAFPAVTICNTNPYPISRLGSVLKSYDPEIEDSEIEDFNYVKTILKTKHRNFNLAQARELGYQPEEFIMAERFRFDEKSCSSVDNLTIITLARRGNCYTFNHNGNVKQSRIGKEYGLTILLNIKQSSYMGESDDPVPVGAYVSVHTPGRITDPIDGSIIAMPNQLTRVSIKKKELTHLAHPYPDNCTNLRKISKNNIPYSVHVCLRICYIEEEYSRCQAVSFYSSIESTPLFGKQLKKAYTSNETACVEQFEVDYHNGNVKCHCPVSCNQNVYATSVSTGIWPSMVHMKKMMKDYPNMSAEYIKENIVALQIYYEDFTVRRIVHEPAYDKNQFYSDLGGQVSLWIGASIFSFVEIGTLILEIITTFMFSKKQKKKGNEMGNA